MNRFKYIAITGLSACLAACGGQDPAIPSAVAKSTVPVVAPASEASSPVAASAPAANDPGPTAPAPAAPAPAQASAPEPSTPAKPVLIEIHGDDAMLGMTSAQWFYANPQSEPSDTQAILQANLNDTAITVSNLAEGGTASTLVNLMNGVDGGGPPFAQRMATSKAQIEVVNHAINDDLGQSLAPYADALVAWVQAVKAAGKVPVLEEPNPVCDDNHPYLANYVSVMDNIAAQYNVPLVRQYEYLKTIPNYCSHLSGGLYPDDAILSIKAQREAEILAPLVKALIAQ